MIPVPPGVRVLIATRPVDFRKGADSLAVLTKLVNLWPAARIEELMPWAWTGAESNSRRAA